MAKSELASFIATVKTDEALRKKIIAAEEKAAKHIIASRKANVDAIKKIAKEAGFDIEKEVARPLAALFPQESEIESSCGVIKDTCCYVVTSCLHFTGPVI
jgi:glucuronate isomerase